MSCGEISIHFHLIIIDQENKTIKVKQVILIILFSGALYTAAQPNVFTEDQFISAVAKFHPVAKQAGVYVRIAKADLLSSRGQFDPRFTSETARKEFGAVTYYDQRFNQVSIPTWYGLEFHAGTEKIGGSRVNPEETSGSITYMGFSVQPLQNLLMDKRRAALLQARNIQLLSQLQRQSIINDLLHDALRAYWDWWEKFQVQQLVTASLVNAEQRFALIKTAYQLGDRPAIDTIEAHTQVQYFQIRNAEAYQDLVKARLQLSAFLWKEDGGTTELPMNAVPQDYSDPRTPLLADVMNSASSHPDLVQYDLKLKGMQIDKKLAFQLLLPEAKLKYNQTGNNVSKTVNAQWFDNNYRFGINVSIPLRLSEGRGDFQKAKLNIESTRLEQTNKEAQLYVKLKQHYTEWQQTQTQLSIQQGLLANTRTLQKGEETKFNNGESSMFLLNARVQKTIEAEQKLIELKAKIQKAAIGVEWSAGILAP